MSQRVRLACAPCDSQPRTQAVKTHRNRRGFSVRSKSEAYPKVRRRGDIDAAETVCQACGMCFFQNTARLHEKECQKRKILRNTKVTIDMLPGLVEEITKKLDKGTNECADAVRLLYILSLKPNMRQRMLIGEEGPTGLLEQLARVSAITEGSGNSGQAGAVKTIFSLLEERENFAMAVEAEIPKALMTVVRSKKHGPLRMQAVEMLKRLATDPALTRALFDVGVTPSLVSHTRAVGNAAVAKHSRRAVSTSRKRDEDKRRDPQHILDSALFS